MYALYSTILLQVSPCDSTLKVELVMFAYLLVTRRSENIQWNPKEICKLSFHLYIFMYGLAKTDAEICHTYLCLQIDSGFYFCGPLGDSERAT